MLLGKHAVGRAGYTPNVMPDLLVRPYQRPHQDALLDLMADARRVHTHLDWMRVVAWLDVTDARYVQTAWTDDQMVAILGISPPFNHNSWVRVCIIDNAHHPPPLLQVLWDSLQDVMQNEHIQRVGALLGNRWLALHLPALGFRYVEDVVTMGRVGVELPPLPPHNFSVQNAYLDSLPDMVRIDHSAFAPPWQLTRDDLRHAQRQSASCTIVRHDGQVIGYQLCTRHDNLAHLARLAVLPAFQGRGVGAVLLDHLIRGFLRRSVRAITVNTQESNIRSQHLYMRYGFRRNGYDLPFWARETNS
jgi:[ribosomal protein S18]-alanine N-acetyltransferase